MIKILKERNTIILKIIAMITMLVDHIGCVFLIGIPYIVTRCIGRLAFPLYVYFLVQGYFFSKNRIEYAKRLIILAIISIIPYRLCTANPDCLNIGFTLIFYFGIISLLESLSKIKYISNYSVIFLQAITIFTGSLIAAWLHLMYSYAGFILLAGFYFGRKNKVASSLGIIMFSLFTGIYLKNYINLILLTEPFLILYFNNFIAEKDISNKYFKITYRYFYPIHLLVLGLIKIIIER